MSFLLHICNNSVNYALTRNDRLFAFSFKARCCIHTVIYLGTCFGIYSMMLFACRIGVNAAMFAHTRLHKINSMQACKTGANLQFVSVQILRNFLFFIYEWLCKFSTPMSHNCIYLLRIYTFSGKIYELVIASKQFIFNNSLLFKLHLWECFPFLFQIIFFFSKIVFGKLYIFEYLRQHKLFYCSEMFLIQYILLFKKLFYCSKLLYIFYIFLI